MADPNADRNRQALFYHLERIEVLLERLVKAVETPPELPQVIPSDEELRRLIDIAAQGYKERAIEAAEELDRRREQAAQLKRMPDLRPS